MFLELSVPPAAPVGVKPELVKSLVDGVVSAFQTHLDESTIDAVAARIANQIHADPNDVGRNLRREDRAVLGPRRRLVHARGAGAQWNPSDHLCAAGQVLRHPGAGGLRARSTRLRRSLTGPRSVSPTDLPTRRRTQRRGSTPPTNRPPRTTAGTTLNIQPDETSRLGGSALRLDQETPDVWISASHFWPLWPLPRRSRSRVTACW